MCALGVVVGMTSWIGIPWLPAAVLTTLACVAWLVPRKHATLLAVFLGILLGARGGVALRLAGLPITVGKLVVAFALGAHVLRCVLRREPLLPVTPATWPLLAVLTTSIASVAHATDLRRAWVELAGVTMLTLLAHLVAAATTSARLPALGRDFAAGAVFVLGVGLVRDRQGPAQLDHLAWQQRSAGAFSDPNIWAAALLVIGPPLLALLAVDRDRRAFPLTVGLLVALVAGVAQSMSRAGAVTLVAIFPALLWLIRARWRAWLPAMLVGVLVLPLLVHVDGLLLRWWTLIDPSYEAGIGGHSLEERKALLQVGAEMIRRHPWAGVGIGNFPVEAVKISSGQVWKIAHNSYITVAAEQGVPGVLAHLWLAWAVFRTLALGSLGAPTPPQRALCQGLLVSMAAGAVMALTLNLATLAIAWFLLGLGLAAARGAPQPSGQLDGGAVAVPDAVRDLVLERFAGRREALRPVIVERHQQPLQR